MHREAVRTDGEPPLWVQLDWDLNCRDRRLLVLRDYWDSKRAGRLMPSRSNIMPEEILPLLPYVVLIDIEPRPFRLRYRLIGTKINEIMGRDSTGQYYDEIYSADLMKDINSSFQALMRRGCRCVLLGMCSIETRTFTVTRRSTCHFPATATASTRCWG